MKTNQEIALEVAKALRQDDLVASLELCTRFLAAVDAERGKDAVGYDEIFNAIAEAASPCGEGIGVSVKAFKRAIGGEIFLSPTIPPNMALVPIPSTSKMDWAGVDAVGLDEFRATDAEKCFNAMVQAAGVTK